MELSESGTRSANLLSSTARYVGSKGTDLNIERNYNQLVGGVHPYLALAANSPIDPQRGRFPPSPFPRATAAPHTMLPLGLSRETPVEGLHNLSFPRLVQIVDDRFRSYQGIVIQNGNNIAGDRSSFGFQCGE